MFSEFEAQRTPTPQEYAGAMKSGMVVLDANVLLSLYRYNDNARQDLLSLLARLGDRLWVPHQVIKEFWGARLSALYERERRVEQVCGEIQKHFKQVRVQLRGWAPDVSLDDERLEHLLGIVDKSADEVEAGVREIASVESERNEWVETHKDPVVSALQSILDGRVGPPFGAEDEASARAEAARRVEHSIPPGYMDGAKDNNTGPGAGDSAGDFFVWEQLLREASERSEAAEAGVDVLFVTADTKEDWWRRWRKHLLGPRSELVDELRARAGGRLLMLQPHEFLQIANESFELDLDPDSVDSVRRADSSYEDTGWTKAGLRALLNQLDDSAPTRAKVIRRAIEQGGHVSRAEVYEIGGYNENRMLTGWTKPIRTWTQYLRDTGVIPANEGEQDVLEVRYEQGSRASGFRIPQQILELFEELADD